MRAILLFLSLWLTLVVFGIADQFNISREPIGIYLIVLGLGFLSTTVHELGHAIAAWKLGFRVHKIAVLPFEYDFASRRLRSANLPRSSDLAGYVVASISNRDSPGKLALFAFGGPFAELILAAALFTGISIHSNTAVSNAEPTPTEMSRKSEADFGEPYVNQTPARAMRHVQQKRRIEIFTGLAVMLQTWAFGSVLINLLPIGGSDGQVIWRSYRRMKKRSSK